MRRLVMPLVGLALCLGGLSVVPGTAVADTAPLDPNDPTTPPTASAKALPTVQINGVVWAQEVIGDTVYVAGDFSKARPAGSAPGINEVPRSNLLAYDIRTGELSDTWKPSANAEVTDIEASPDKSRLYIAGNFTDVNGKKQHRIAALNPTTGARIGKFNPNPNARVRSVVATDTTVYFGGYFGTVGGVTRQRFAAARASDGALTTWAPAASNGYAWDMALSPDDKQVLLVGSFTTINGSSYPNPGTGMASVDAVTGALKPWAATSLIRNSGNESAAITSVETDGQYVYASGATFSKDSNLEGVVKMKWDGGGIVWIEDCHGDSLDTYPSDDVLYVASHAHYCGNLPNGFPQPDPWKKYRGTAFTTRTTGTLLPEYNGYFNFAGNPSPSLLHWFPNIQSGTFTGQGQGAWAVDGNADYVVMGGEFPTAGGLQQQGLVRFSKNPATSIPPSETPAGLTPTVRSTGTGEVLVSWRTSWDRDNADLTYEVVRDGNFGSPINSRVVSSADWDRPYQSYLDTTATPGSTTSYRIVVRDPAGNQIWSNPVNVVVATSGTADAYAKAVAADGPENYWRFSEPSGTTVADYMGRSTGTLTGAPVRGGAGVIPGDPSIQFDGTSNQKMYTSASEMPPFWYSVEAWFNTTTTNGGKIVSFATSQTGTSTTNPTDHTLYMDGSGRINFGSRQDSNKVVTSGSGLNDGQWHQAVGVQTDKGMTLYIDGVRVARRDDVRVGMSREGWWRIGGDSLGGWPNRPISDYFAGSIDEVSVYHGGLTATQVSDHYTAATGVSVNHPPTASFTTSTDGAIVSVDATDSSDDDGTIASYSWNWGDGSPDTTGQTQQHTYTASGDYTITLTVTDDDGATDSVTRTVHATMPVVVAQDDFSRTVAGSWGTAPLGGTWTSSGTGKRSVDGASGVMKMAKGNAGWNRLPLTSADVDAAVDFTLDKKPGKGGVLVATAVRSTAKGEYRFRVTMTPDRKLSLAIYKLVGTKQTRLGAARTLTLLSNPGKVLRLRFQINGADTATLQATLWKAGATEPAAQVVRTDATKRLRAGGAVGVYGKVGGKATNAPVTARFDNLTVTDLG